MAERYRFKVGVQIQRGAAGKSYFAGQSISHEECESLLKAKEIRPEWVEPEGAGDAPSRPQKKGGD